MKKYIGEEIIRIPPLENKAALDAARRRWVVPCPTEDELFWMRVDGGRRYLAQAKYPPDVKRALQDDPVFWRWFNSLWDMNDLRILNVFCPETYGEIEPRHYTGLQDAMLGKYRVNRTLMDIIKKGER